MYVRVHEACLIDSFTSNQNFELIFCNIKLKDLWMLSLLFQEHEFHKIEDNSYFNMFLNGIDVE